MGPGGEVALKRVCNTMNTICMTKFVGGKGGFTKKRETSSNQMPIKQTQKTFKKKNRKPFKNLHQMCKQCVDNNRERYKKEKAIP